MQHRQLTSVGNLGSVAAENQSNNKVGGTSGVPPTIVSRPPAAPPAAAPPQVSPQTRILSANQVANRYFETIGLTGRFRELIGDPCPGFKAMIYGLPKSGKSTLSIDFAKELAMNHGATLYVAVEEGVGQTLQDKIRRMKAGNVPGLYFTDKMPDTFSGYKYAFIDSINDAGLDTDALKALAAKNPGVGFIYIVQSTKAGNFRGDNTIEHLVDVTIRVEAGVAYAKGRFGTGQMNVVFS